MSTQSIIVYRNPLEAAFYENGGPLIMLVVFMLAAIWISLYIITDKVVYKFWPSATQYRQWRHSWIPATLITIVVAFLGILVFQSA